MPVDQECHELWSKRRRKGLKDLTKPGATGATNPNNDPTTTLLSRPAVDQLTHRSHSRPRTDQTSTSLSGSAAGGSVAGFNRRQTQSTSTAVSAGIAQSHSTNLQLGAAGRSQAARPPQRRSDAERPEPQAADVSLTGAAPLNAGSAELQQRMMELTGTSDLTVLLDAISAFMGSQQPDSS